MSEDESLLTKCLEFAKLLSETEKFSFQLRSSSSFNFSFSNCDPGMPELSRKKKKKTPSQIKRNQERMKNFLENKKHEASGTPDNASEFVEYTMKMEAHANCTTADIVEVIKVNFVEDLDSENVGKEDPVRDVNIRKVDEKQVIRKIEGLFRNLQVFSISFKHDPVAIKVVENWKDEKKFDDQAFLNSSNGGLKIQVREVQRRK